jgi:hypothetical protein
MCHGVCPLCGSSKLQQVCQRTGVNRHRYLTAMVVKLNCLLALDRYNIEEEGGTLRERMVRER